MRTPEQRRQLQDHLSGIEKKPIAYLLATMNMLLHGIEVPNIIQSNALVTNIQQLYDEDYVDIIATIPPFGGEEERSTINNFPQDMRTGETPLLFVQYIMQHSNGLGDVVALCCQMAFSSAKALPGNKARYLLSFNLHTIVRLPKVSLRHIPIFQQIFFSLRQSNI